MLVMVVFFIAFRWIHLSTPLIRLFLLVLILLLMPTLNFLDRKSGSAGMPRPISYAVFCLKKKKEPCFHSPCHLPARAPFREREHLSVDHPGTLGSSAAC